MPSPAANDDRRLRRPEEFAGERGGYAPWCGPAVVATASGLTYASACELLSRVAPERYPPGREIVSAWWSDLLGALDLAGVRAAPHPVHGRPRLDHAVRDALPEGWWLTRVTDHFCLVRVARSGQAVVFDNRHHGVPLSSRTHGRKRVTHLARVPSPPGAE
jgi:hypothetical protein